MKHEFAVCGKSIFSRVMSFESVGSEVMRAVKLFNR